jgi:hypothetical protein
VQHWYVYYKLMPAERDALCERVRQMQEHIAGTTAVRVRLLERAEPGETTTVMEVYEDIADADAFGLALDSAVRDHLPGPHAVARRVERFQDA